MIFARVFATAWNDGTRAKVHARPTGINHFMIFEWTEALPITLKDLNPFHQELIGYIANLPGKRRPTLHPRLANMGSEQTPIQSRTSFGVLGALGRSQTPGRPQARRS